MGEFFSEGGDQVSLVTRRERSVETTVELSTMSGRAEGRERKLLSGTASWQGTQTQSYTT